jgi:hypothetical protein
MKELITLSIRTIWMTQMMSSLLKAHVVVDAHIGASNHTATRHVAKAVHRLDGGAGGGE